MADPISVASFALSLTSKATEALNALRERAQRSKDVEIKDQISTLYDIVLQLKEAISRLMDENKELKRQLEQQQLALVAVKIRQVGETNYYFQGDDGPFCQVCYDKDNKLVKLLPSQPWSGGIRTECPVCGEFFYEKTGSKGPKQITPIVRRYT